MNTQNHISNEVVTLSDKHHVIAGDNSGNRVTYVWCDGFKIHKASSPAEIIKIMNQKGCKPVIHSKAISFLLHNSLVPTPMTVFEGVYALGVGDEITFDMADLSKTPVFSCKYRYFQDQSSGHSSPSTQTLLELLCSSLERKIQKPSVLMLSSGKDSVAIALAMRECGWAGNIPSYTYADPESGYDQEANDAKKIAHDLGLSHTIIEVRREPEPVKKALLHFFENASYPSCDPTTIPYVVGLYHQGINSVGIIDGTRSDMSMGIIPTREYHMLYRYYSLIGGGWSRLSWPTTLIPYHSKAVKFFMTQPEINLYRHGHFRSAETKRFNDSDCETTHFWLNEYKKLSSRDLIDNYAFINDQFFAGCGILPKITMVAEALSAEAILPWADQAIADYYFNLPQDYKYDTKTRTNKILLRKMLLEKMGYDAAQFGKRIFYFNAQKFVQDHYYFIREEIVSCSLWNGSIENEFKRYVKLLEVRPRAASALIDLFMISGWFNHSKYLKGCL